MEPNDLKLILHEWALDEDGDIDYFELGGYHGGPKCVRCGYYFCQHCNPECLTEACDEQTRNLF